MRSYSPLRYPGGKFKLAPYVLETLRLNNLIGGAYVEPFAGGAAIAWFLLLERHVSSVYINDLNPSIHAFWHSVLNDSERLCELIENTEVTMDEWHRQKQVFENQSSTLLERGFSTFFLNRTNRSGIIKGGVIGGKNQDGNYKLDCRFNRNVLIHQINAIAERRDSIHLTNLDASQFIEEVLPDLHDQILVNIDPPYYVKGKGLYQDFFEHEDHYRLFQSVRNIRQPWIVTYDDTPEINDIYNEFSPQPFGLTYTAQDKRKGTEVIIHKTDLLKFNAKPDITFRELSKLKKSTSLQLVK